MRAGKLDRRVTLQRADATQSTSGQPVQTWRDIATVWAALVPLKGWERTSAPGVAAHEEVSFEVRWSSQTGDLNPKDRLIYDGSIYDITSTDEIGRRRGVKIIAWRKAD